MENRSRSIIADKFPSLSVLRKIIHLNKRYYPWYILVGTSILLNALIDVVGTETLRQMLNAASNRSLRLLKNAFILAIIVIISNLIVRCIRTYFIEMLNYKASIDLQSKAIKKLMTLDVSHLDKYHSADISSRLNEDINTLQTGVNGNIFELINLIMIIVFNIVYLCVLNISFTLICIIMTVISSVIIDYISKKMYNLYQSRKESNAFIEAYIQDAVQGAEIIRVLSLRDRLVRIFLEKYENVLKITKKVLFFESLTNQFNFIVRIGGMIFIMGYGGFLVSKGLLDIGSVVTFFLVFWRILNPVSRLATIWPKFQESLAFGNRILEILNIPTEPDIETGITNISDAICRNVSTNSKMNISFNNVSFGYSNSVKVLNNISFTAEEGKITAIVGPSGGGKSTILKLLLRLYEPLEGKILFAGVPIESLNIIEWREKIAFVSQDPYLFSGTFYENISYGKIDATETEIIEAAKRAGIHELIMDTPDRYNTNIGEKGQLLSGGERQRLSIARAFLRKPQILILDEPTASLDSENEYLVQKAIEQLMKGKTTIVVSHKLSMIKNADKIIYIENGCIKETGTHEELLNLKGSYFNMFNTLITY